MALVVDKGHEDGVFRCKFIAIKPDMKENEEHPEWQSQAHLVFKDSRDKKIALFIALDDRFAEAVAMLTGMVAPVSIRDDELELFMFGKKALADHYDGKDMYVSVSGGFGKYLVLPPERVYYCRFGGIVTRDRDTGLARMYEREYKRGNEVINTTHMLMRAVVQDGPYTGWATVGRVPANYSWSGKDLHIGDRTGLYQVLTTLGVTPEIMNGVEFDGIDPAPQLEAVLFKLAENNPFSVPVDDKGYTDWKKIEHVSPDVAPPVPFLLDVEGGKVAMGPKGKDKEVIEALEILAGILDDQDGPIVNVGNFERMNDRGVNIARVLLRPLSGVLPGMVDESGRGLWPPSKWDDGEVVLLVLKALLKNVKKAKEIMDNGDEAITQFVNDFYGNEDAESEDVAW